MTNIRMYFFELEEDDLNESSFEQIYIAQFRNLWGAWEHCETFA